LGTHPGSTQWSGAWLLPAQAEGFYATVAMVNAYFNCLEHLFVLMLPFSHFDPTKESLASFIRDNWGDKYKRIIPLANNLDGQRFLERLRHVAEGFPHYTPISRANAEIRTTSLSPLIRPTSSTSAQRSTS